MLTPAFELRQDATCLIIVIKARYAKVTETEMFVDGANFKFYSKPYFLRLNLPGRLVEDGREKASYDVESGSFTIRIPKETPGEEFEGLDLLTRLLAPQGQASAKEPSIEVIGKDDSSEKEKEGREGGDQEEEDFDWQVSQEPFSGDEERINSPVGSSTYGFANRRSGVFKRLRDELCGVVEIQQADDLPLFERKRARMVSESEKFNDEHYLADLYQEDAISPIIQYKPPWVLSYRRMRERLVSAGDTASTQPTPEVIFSDDEKELMLKLPRKEYILSNVEKMGALLGVADILFAYAYNVRTLEGEKSVESAWTVCKLSSTLSFLDWFSSPRDLVIACCRRALCYPLYRNWDLCRKVLKDVRMMLRLGRNQVLKCFFDIHKLLSNDEPRYILNDLYISDYCVWLQTIDDQSLLDLESEIGKVQIEKKDVDLDLDDLEEAASQVKREEQVSPGRMETTEHSDNAGNGHRLYGGGDHQPGDVSQVGYPDLIQRSTPAPDILSSHVVKNSEGSNMDRESVEGIEHSDDGEDDDEAEEDSSDEDDEEDDSSDEEDNEVVEGMKENYDYGRTCPDNLEPDAVCSADQSDSVSKDTSAVIDVGLEASGQAGLSDSQSNLNKTKCNSIGKNPSSDEGVTETMQVMLDQLSLEPRGSSLLDESQTSEHIGKIASRNDPHLDWFRRPPHKTIEMLDEN